MQRRVAIASFYDEKGIVDDYLIFLLKELRGFTENIISSPMERFRRTPK